MSLTKLLPKQFLAAAALAVVVLALAAGFSALAAKADVVFLTRQNRIMSTYPQYNAFSIGTSTVPGSGNATSTTGIGKLAVTLSPDDAFLNTLDGYRKAFAIASTSTAGGTATTTKDIFSIRDTGCINAIATSSATPIRLNMEPKGATSTFSGTVYWSYGTCP